MDKEHGEKISNEEMRKKKREKRKP